MLFSVCIPNYNYDKDLGKTISSILNNRMTDLEIVIADNASTDNSVDLVKKAQVGIDNIKLKVNLTNVGFAANLERAAGMASGKYMIMLSSDDLMKAGALAVYRDILEIHPMAVMTSSVDVIDGEEKITGYIGPDKNLWNQTDVDEVLSSKFGCVVYRAKSATLLNRCLLKMANPFNFCAVVYPRSTYLNSGGYTSRLINPDKWFHWKMLVQADEAIYVDKAFFQYRVHNQNQWALQSRSGHLKFLLDEYRNVIELDDTLLSKANMRRDDCVQSFLLNDIYRHGIGEFLKGRWLKSLRVYFFGLSTFPGSMLLKLRFLLYTALLLTTPIGSFAFSKVLRLEDK